MWWIGLVQALLGDLAGAAGTFFQNQTANRQIAHEENVHRENFALQQEQFQWTKGQQELMHQREDTAVQRRVADLKAAGLSPVLAAGSAAQTHQPVQTHAPQRGVVNYMNRLTAAEAFVNMIRQGADIARTAAETRRIQELTRNDVQERDIRYKDYLLREQGLGLDKERVRVLGEQLGISYRQLEHDALRIAHDHTRIVNETQRVFNDNERVQLEKNSYQLQSMMNQAQREQISIHNWSEQLRQLGIGVDTERKILEYEQLVYDFTLMKNLGYPTGAGMAWQDRMNLSRGEAAIDAVNRSGSLSEMRIRNSQVYENYLRMLNIR